MSLRSALFLKPIGVLAVLVLMTLPSPTRGQGKCMGGMVNGTWPCDRVELIAHLPNASMGGMNANDLWGWTDPMDGREYVLFGQRDGTWFIDVTDPALPRVVGELPTEGVANSLWRDIKVAGHHMVVVSEAVNSRLQVFDLTRLRDHLTIALPVVFDADTVMEGFNKAHNLAVHEPDSLVFVCGPQAIEGLLVYDFSQPDAPQLVGSWSEAYVHDAQVVTYAGPDSDHLGKRLAFASCADDVRILDVTDPADITEIAVTGHQPYGYIHQGWLTPDHRHFLLGDESDESGGLVPETHTYIFDVSDLDNPVWVSAESLGTQGTDHNLYTRGDFVHESNYADGYRSFLFSEEGTPWMTPKAFFDTQPDLDAPGFQGSWSHYPYFDSGTIAVSDQSEGLFLIRTQYMRAWPDFPSVCPSDTLRLLVSIDPCVGGAVSVDLPEGASWISVDSLPGPGTWPLELAGFNWDGMQGLTLRMEGQGTVHAYQMFVEVTEDAQHYPDADGDGYGVFDGVVTGCSPGPGYAHVGGDCDDQNPDVRPGIEDPCDGIDNDCDQAIDEDGESIPFYLDLDGDGVPGSLQFEACIPPPNAVFAPGADCNDLDATMYPGAAPTLEGVDNDCNGYILGLEQLDGGCPGDLTGDDYVNIQDLLEFLNLYGSSGFFEADFNFDQHIGVSDLLLMLGYLGNQC